MLTEIQLLIAHLRAERGWTQRILAEKTGLTKAFLGRLELGQHDPSLSTLIKLAKAFQLTIVDLLRTRSPSHTEDTMMQLQPAVTVSLVRDTFDQYTSTKGLQIMCEWAGIAYKHRDREGMLDAIVAHLGKGRKP